MRLPAPVRSSPAPPHGPPGLTWLLAFMCLALPVVADAQALEYRVKAAFLFNFAKFVEWPQIALPPRVPLRVGIWAPPAPFEIMADALAGKEVDDHPLAVYRYERRGSPPQVLFVHAESEPIPEDLLQEFVAAHVLLVGETPGFASRYGVIGLVPHRDSLRFQVNVDAAQRAHLTLSGQLARLAEIVKDQP